MSKTLAYFIATFLCCFYLAGEQKFYSITLIKNFENEKEYASRISWLNFPISENYRFVENQELKKIIVKRLSVLRNKDQYLKLCEWNIRYAKDEEKTIESVLYDHDYYIMAITLNGFSGFYNIVVKKAKKEALQKSIVKISGFLDGEPLVDLNGNIKEFEILSFEISPGNKFFVSIESLKSIMGKEVFEPIFRPINHKGYALYIPTNIEHIGDSIGKNYGRVIANITTDIYGKSNTIDFLCGKKILTKILRDNLKKWALDCWGLPTPQFHRTIFFNKHLDGI